MDLSHRLHSFHQSRNHPESHTSHAFPPFVCLAFHHLLHHLRRPSLLDLRFQWRSHYCGTTLLRHINGNSRISNNNNNNNKHLTLEIATMHTTFAIVIITIIFILYTTTTEVFWSSPFLLPFPFLFLCSSYFSTQILTTATTGVFIRRYKFLLCHPSWSKHHHQRQQQRHQKNRLHFLLLLSVYTITTI